MFAVLVSGGVLLAGVNGCLVGLCLVGVLCVDGCFAVWPAGLLLVVGFLL